MPFLRVNQVEFPVAVDTYSEDVREVGEETVAYSGLRRRSRRALKRDCTFESSPMTGAEAHAWAQILMGEGQSWTFETTHYSYSTKGLGPSSVTGVIEYTTPAKYGSTAARLFAGETDVITYTPGVTGGKATIFYWGYRGSWARYVHDSDGRKWVDGVRNDAASTPWVTSMTGTSFTFDADATTTLIDGLHWWPFVVPDVTWAETWGSIDRNLGLSPQVELSGDVIEEVAGYRFALCSVRSVALQAHYGGSWTTDLRKLIVEAREA